LSGRSVWASVDKFIANHIVGHAHDTAADAEVLHEIANRPHMKGRRSHVPPPSKFHGDKRREKRAEAKVNLRKEMGE
jgi:hypothetical protein